MKLTGIGEVPLKMYSSPWSIRHHRCVLTNISKYFRFSETKRINLNNIDTWLVNSFGFRILELEMATNESFENVFENAQHTHSRSPLPVTYPQLIQPQRHTYTPKTPSPQSQHTSNKSCTMPNTGLQLPAYSAI